METTAIIAAAFVFGLAGQSQPVAEFYGCEMVDMGGYLNFADPTCPNTASADYALGPVFDSTGAIVGEAPVPTNNK